MTRRSSATPVRAGRTRRALKVQPRPVAEPSRADRLVEMIDHLTAAKQSADEMHEMFLAYLLAMAIQETRTAMRSSRTAVAAVPEKA